VPLKAFLVEDVPTVASALTEVLMTLAQTEVVGVSTGAMEASAWLLQNSHRWDLAIIDLSLASGSGLSVLAACRVRQAHQRAVVVSNLSNSTMRMRCKAFGADAFFDKSTQLDEFVHYCAKLTD